MFLLLNLLRLVGKAIILNFFTIIPILMCPIIVH
jgi:hypothetical protein